MRPRAAVGAGFGFAVQLDVIGRGRNHDRERHGRAQNAVAVCTELTSTTPFGTSSTQSNASRLRRRVNSPSPPCAMFVVSRRHVRESDGFEFRTVVSSSMPGTRLWSRKGSC